MVEMKSCLLKLCNPKLMFLVKAIKKPSFDDPNEIISINPKFANPGIKHNLIPMKSAMQIVSKEKDMPEVDPEV